METGEGGRPSLVWPQEGFTLDLTAPTVQIRVKDELHILSSPDPLPFLTLQSNSRFLLDAVPGDRAQLDTDVCPSFTN